MASSSSMSRNWIYQVFPSFCGGDVRRAFLSHFLKEFIVRTQQNGLIVRYGSNQLHIPALLGDTEQLYIFEDSFSLTKDFPEAKEDTLISKLVFEFIVHDKTWKVKSCGVSFLEVPHNILDGKETEDEDCMDRNIETNNETEDVEESGGDDDAETRSRKRTRLSPCVGIGNCDV